MGDFVDFYGFSKFIKSPDAMSTSDELKEARKQAKWIAKWFPQMTILMGNHEKRLYKRATEAGIPSALLKSLEAVLELPSGLKYTTKDYVQVGNTVVTHGHLTSANARKAHMDFYGKNVVFGHLHNQLGVEYNARTEKKIWGMSTSCIVDTDSIAMRYQVQDWKNIICGFGYEVDNKPGVVCLS